MKGTSDSAGTVAPVPRRPLSRLVLGEEVLLSPKTELDILVQEGAGAAEKPQRLGLVGAAAVIEGLQELTVQQGNARVKSFPKSEAAWVQLGLAELARGSTESALSAFERAIKINPQSRNARLARARTLNDGGRHSEAVAELRQLQVDHPEDLEIRVALAITVCDLEGPASAVEILAASVPSAPRSASLLATRGSLRVALGHHRLAVPDLRQALRWKPEWAHAKNVLGIAELRLGNVRSAEKRFREAVRTAPMYLEGFLNLLRVLMHQERFGDVLSEAADRYPDPSKAPPAVGRISSQAAIAASQWGLARVWLEAALRGTSDSNARARLENDLGVVFARMRRFGDAEKRFRDSFESDPSDLAATNRARALSELGRHADAVKWLREAGQLAPEPSSDRLEVFAAALNASREHREAVRILESLVEDDRANAGVYANLIGMLVDHESRVSDAVRVARSALAKYADNPALVNNAAYAFLMAGLGAEAAAALALPTVGAAARDIACLTATRGLLMLWADEIEQGIELYELSLATAPSDDLRSRIRAKRDLEVARAFERRGAPPEEVARYLNRAAEGGADAYPYSDQARAELKRLKP